MNRFVTGVGGANRFGLMLLAGAFLVGPAFLDSALPGLAGQLRAEPAATQNPQPDGRLAEVIAGDWRSAEAKARDVHRHPAETLQFFGLRDDASYAITDGNGTVTVAFTGVLPDLFREGQGIVAEGYWRAGTFEATEVLAKHDENYMPKEVADALRAQGHWEGAPAAE